GLIGGEVLPTRQEPSQVAPPPPAGPLSNPPFGVERAMPSTGRVAEPPRIARTAPARPAAAPPVREVPQYENFYSLHESPFGWSVYWVNWSRPSARCRRPS